MNEDLISSTDPIEPQGDNDKRRRTLIILGAAFVLAVICAVVLIAGWYLGDFVVEWLTSLF